MIIEVDTVTKRFSTLEAVKDVSFTVDRGEIVGFVGANGAGKSTTINMLLGFIRPSRGTVRLFGDLVVPSLARASHEKIGFAAGDMELPSQLTGEQYLAFVAAHHRSVTTKRKQQLIDIFQPQLSKKIGTLSRGNKQKIALIAAFLPSPALVILDEPTSGLDPVMQEKFLELVHSEKARGVTIFMSSHYLGEVAQSCTRVLLMRSGRLIEDISAAQLRKKSGKRIRVVTGYKNTKPPRGAKESRTNQDSAGQTVIEFVWGGKPSTIQQWVAGIKQLIDIEITEYNLEGAFKGMYEEPRS